MTDIKQNVIWYLQKSFPNASVLSEKHNLLSTIDKTVTGYVYLFIAHDWSTGIMYRVIGIQEVNSLDTIKSIAYSLSCNNVSIFNVLNNKQYMERLNLDNPQKAHEFNTKEFVFSPRLILYTNITKVPEFEILNIFKRNNLLLDIVLESAIYCSAFISYGGPDEDYVSHINKALTAHSIKTYFFPENSIPGKKLHREMHNQVNSYDKVILICSKPSLSRPGVLNEIERVLEREAREGGASILIPISIDDFVFSEWHPANMDIAIQIRDRIIAKFPDSHMKKKEFRKSIDKLLISLRKYP